jgi:methionyl-tRNA synthetase
MSRFYVTTPIYYVNDVPHLGTAYTTIVVDAVRRFHVLRGDDTRMLTGTDEHGLKIEREARERGMSPVQFVAGMSERFKELWPRLEIQSDDFVRTTEKRHEDRVQELWRTIAAKGDLYLGDYEGWYCVACEELKTEKELVQPGNLCPLHQRPVERVKEKSYFFALSKYEKRLLDWYEQHPEFIQPESRRNEVLSFVKGGLRDLSVSRANFSWGIPVPDDVKHVMYVWFDALANYWSVLQDSDALKAFWTDGKVVHLVGKDILRFHTVYWPAFLMSAGLPLPTTVFAHGFLTLNGQKMSKTLRNTVSPLGIAKTFGGVVGSEAGGADVLRYQLLRAIAFGQDGDFDFAAMIERYNADLGDNLGNLLSRTLGLCARMTDGKVPARGPLTVEDEALGAKALQAARAAAGYWEELAPHRALEETFALSNAANVYVDRMAPWAEAKKGNTSRVGTILATLLQVLECLSVMIWPVLPKKSEEMRHQLGLGPVVPRKSLELRWWPEGIRWREAGEQLGTAVALFPKIDKDGAKKVLEELAPREEQGAGAGPMTSPSPSPSTTTSTSTSTSTIAYEGFEAVDLRVGVVKACERVPKKDKLLRLTVDVGEAEARTIVAGLALSFQPEELVGKRVIVVANLAPREFGKGLVSHGMLLATGPSEKLTLATVAGDVEPGAKLK